MRVRERETERERAGGGGLGGSEQTVRQTEARANTRQNCQHVDKHNHIARIQSHKQTYMCTQLSDTHALTCSPQSRQ